MRYYRAMHILSRRWILRLLIVALLLSAAVIVRTTQVSAACQPSGDFGSVTFSNNVSIPVSGTYRAWSRIQIPSSANNNYMLEVNGTCYTVGGNGSLATNTWSWVDYQSGGSKINIQLNQGTHTVKMFGTSDGVLLDRVLFTQVASNTTCTPSGTGDNCAVAPDTTAPTASLTAPNAGATVSGTVAVNANASDDSGTVSKVDFFLNGAATPFASDNTSPYSVNWDTTKVPDGVYNLTAKAYDTAGNVGTSTGRSVTVANGKPDFVVSGITWVPTSPKANENVTFTAVIKNQGSLAGVPGNIKFEVGSTTVNTVNSSTSLAAGASRTVTATASWKAVAGNQTVKVTADSSSAVAEANENNNVLSLTFAVSSVDTTNPVVSLTAPSNGAVVTGTSNITANASDAGGSNLSRVEFFVGGKLVDTKTTAPFTFGWNTLSIANGSYQIYAVAFDGAGNRTQSATVTVTVGNETTARKPGDANNDGVVNMLDFSILAANWNLSGKAWEQADFNGDGVVNMLDFSILAANWNK